MLTILLNSQTVLDIDADTSITLEYSNPLFVFDGLPGMASYQFTIPASPRNNHAFEHANTIATQTGEVNAYPVQVQADGIPLLNGFLSIEGATPYRYTCTIVTDFLHRLKNLTLRGAFKNTEPNYIPFEFNGITYQIPYGVWELEHMGDDTTEVLAHVTGANNGTYPTYTHCFPLFTSERFFDGAAGVNGIPQTWVSYYPHRFFNLVTSGVQYFDQNTLVPWFYVPYILLTALQRQNLVTNTDITQDAEFCTLCIANSQTLDQWVFDQNIQQNDIVISRHLPDVPISEFLIDLRQKFGIVFYFDLNSQQVGIYFQSNLVNQPAVDISEKVEPLYSIDFAGAVKPPTLCHADDSTDAQTDSVGKEIENFTITDTVANLNDLPAPAGILPNELYFVAAQNAFYNVVAEEDPNNPGNFDYAWALYTYNYLCTPDAGGEQLDSSLPVLMTETHRYDAANPNTTWLLPKYEVYANTQELATLFAPPPPVGIFFTQKFMGNPFNLRYAFYRGMQPDSAMAGYTYPLATPEAYNAAGTRIGTFTLNFNGADGIYNRYWHPFISRIAYSKVVEKTIRFTAYDISQLNMAAKYQVQEQTGLVHYFIQKLTVTITQNGIQETKCAMVQVI